MPPHQSLGTNATEVPVEFSLLLVGGVGENVVVATSKIDTSMPMEGIFDAFTTDKTRSYKIAVDVSHVMGQIKVIIRPFIFITNSTEYYFRAELDDEIYEPGFTGPLVCASDIRSGDFILKRSKLRPDGTFLNIDNHIISLKRSGALVQDGDLHFSIITKSDRVHMIVTVEKQDIILHNLLDEDILIAFVTAQGEMLRSMYIIQGSQHKICLQKADHILRLTVGKYVEDILVHEIHVGAILALGDKFLYRPREGSIEVRSTDRKVDVSLCKLRVFVSRAQVIFYHNPRVHADQNSLRVDLSAIEGILRRGLIPEFSTVRLRVAEHCVWSSCSDEEDRLCASLSRLHFCIEVCGIVLDSIASIF